MRLGFGLRLGQGFPVCASISAGHANRCTSALFKPGLQISRTRLARTHSLRKSSGSRGGHSGIPRS